MWQRVGEAALGGKRDAKELAQDGGAGERFSAARARASMSA
jgi:hypothetical protein